MKRQRHERRGFVLIAVMLTVVVMVASVGLALKEVAAGFEESGGARSRELVMSAMQHGLNSALDELQVTDPAAIAAGNVDWDIFACPSGRVCAGYILEMTYPPSGAYQGDMTVRVGLRQGQRTRAPAGEDVRGTYGHIVEVQLSVQIDTVGNQAEERAVVGVRLPHVESHSN
jgi:hypothetical protein